MNMISTSSSPTLPASPCLRRLRDVLVGLSLSFVTAASAAAANIAVTTLDDDAVVDGDCSLREAITAANTNAPVDACPAGGGADTISFDVSGTIVLGSTLPPIEGPLVIDGPGAPNLVISGNGAVRVFTVGLSVSAELKNLTVANGSDPLGLAGGIENGGILTLRNCTFTGNRASIWSGAIRNANRLTVTDSTFSGNGSPGTAFGGAITGMGLSTSVTGSRFDDNQAQSGGALFNSQPNLFSVASSSFSGNTANAGGAIQNRWIMTVERSTFSGNVALTGGGGALLDTGFSTTTTVTNSTFSGNSAPHGGAIANNNSHTMTIRHCTFSGNRANAGAATMTGFATTTFRNTLFANNTTTISPDNCARIVPQGTIVDGGGNLTYPDTTCPGVNANPLLGPLADNGGPTRTHALGTGSAAIDTAVLANCLPTTPTDQRGVARPFGAACDVGAYEADNQPPVADAGGDQTEHCEGDCTASVLLDGTGSSDPDGDVLTYAWSGASVAASGATPTVSLPRGTHLITLTVSDGKGGSDSDTVEVTVSDVTPPTFSGVPGPIVAECSGAGLTPVSVPLPAATDNCDGSVDVGSNAPAEFPLGTTTVVFSTLDSSSNEATATTTVTVGDATAPGIGSLSAAPDVLWPPNHMMIPVTIAASAADTCGSASCQIDSVTSNEPVSDPAGDWQITGPLSLTLRAERLGSGSGRQYTIAVKCSDQEANASTGTVIVRVPKSQGQ